MKKRKKEMPSDEEWEEMRGDFLQHMNERVHELTLLVSHETLFKLSDLAGEYFGLDEVAERILTEAVNRAVLDKEVSE